MAERRTRKRPQHPLRIAFRWSRIALLLVVTFFFAVVLWCNVFGFPSFLGNILRTEMHRRNIGLEFAKLRLKGFRHIVAQDVSLQFASSTNAPRFHVGEAEILFDFAGLRNGEFDITGINLRSGRLNVPIDGAAAKALSVTNITADVAFLPGDTLRVADFSAEALGARARLSGELKSLSKFRFTPQAGSGGRTDWQAALVDVLEVAEQLEFKQQPELSVSIFADGADLSAARASVILRSAEASSRWGTFDRLEISSAIAPGSSNSTVRGSFLSEITGFRTQSGLLEFFKLEAQTEWTRNMERLLTNHVRLLAGKADARWFRCGGAEAILSSGQESSNSPIQSTILFASGPVEASGIKTSTNLVHAQVAHPLPFSTPAAWLSQLFSGRPREPLPGSASNSLTGEWRLQSEGLIAGRAELESVRLVGTVSADHTQPSADHRLGFWRFLAPLRAPWQMVVTNIRAGEIALGSITAGGDWRFPQLSLTNMDARLYGGYLQGRALLDVPARRVSADIEADFPYEKAAMLLDKPVQKWLAQFSWEDSPFVASSLNFRLPEWTNDWPALDRTILSTLQIGGRFDGSGKFLDVPVHRATSRFTFTNYIWELPDLVLTRPEGQLSMRYTGNVTNAAFHAKLTSGIDPAALKTLFPKEHQLALGIVKFVQPPLLEAEAWGNWDDDSRLGLRASITATNFFIKEQAFTDLRGDVEMTNGLIHCHNLLVHRGQEELRAPYLRVDLPGEVMFVTNAVSTMDPYIAMSLVGEDAYEAIDPYRFAAAPTVRVNGLVPLRHWSKADLHFEVAGNEFAFWRFRMPSLVGDVYWKADHIAFSNITANFYGGKAHWSGYFVIDHKDDSANFSFAGNTTNTTLKYLVADLTGKTNQMEGTLEGELIITSANSENDRSWTGFGSASVQDGLLWSVPIFGVFSPILDGIAPGVGASRISSGSGTFAITNSVVYTRDMQVRAPAFRLSYKGQVDLDAKLDATVEAQIFRDVWVVGKLFSAVLWPVSKVFEAKVSGTLDAPKTDLRLLPKILLAPFRVLNAIGNAATDKRGSESALEQPATPPPGGQ